MCSPSKTCSWLPHIYVCVWLRWHFEPLTMGGLGSTYHLVQEEWLCTHIFFFFFLGPFSLCTECTTALGLLCSPNIPFNTASVALRLVWRGKGPLLRLCLCLLVQQSASQRHYNAVEPATANNVLHCFSLRPAKSADWIPIKQAHSVQVPPYRSMPCLDRRLTALVHQRLPQNFPICPYMERHYYITHKVNPITD